VPDDRDDDRDHRGEGDRRGDDDHPPSGGLGPFAGLPLFGDLARLLSDQGPLNWEAARQFAMLAATGGRTEPNADPLVRLALIDLARVAELHVSEVSGLPLLGGGRPLDVATLTRGAWAQRTLDDYRPLYTELATSLGQRPTLADEAPDPMAAMMAGLSQLLAPAMMGMAVGSMVGRLAVRAFGEHDLPLPRPDRAELAVVPDTVDAFAAEWDLPRDDVRLWVIVHETAARSLYRVPHVREAVQSRVRAHVAAFRPDPAAIVDRLSSLDVEPSDLGDADAMAQLSAGLERLFSDPEVLLGAVRTPEQDALAPELDALVALVVGWIDHVVDRVGARLLGQPGRISEAVRRRRVEASPDDVFVERLLGLRLDRRHVERGRSFIEGVVERAGDDGLARLYRSERELPTPSELDAPGLWLARIDLPD
jgi:putative hydrolase